MNSGLKILFLLYAVFLVVGCSPRIQESIRYEYRDSVRVEYRERLVHDTVRVEIPVEIVKVVNVSDSSHIETSFAVSEAVMKDGMLHHSIWNKPSSIEVPVEIPVTDTTEFHHQLSVTDTVQEKIKYVEKELSLGQKIKINLFWELFFGLLISVGWIFRKPLIAGLKLLLKL